MEFKFDANQEYQLTAIDAVVSLFNGQPHMEAVITFGTEVILPEHAYQTDLPLPADRPKQMALSAGLAAVPNQIELTPEEILRNLRDLQEANGIEPDAELKYIAGEIETAEGKAEARFPNFSVEMETGTGKTYVYIRTVLELYQRYGMRKFIVVVPSIAVREGVLKSLKVTSRHLKELYSNPTYRFYVYDSASLSQVRGFATSSGVEIMVMTLDSFNKAVKEDGAGGNVIFKSTDKLSGEKPIHLIQNTRPILILDEPQNMESEKSVEALKVLNPLCALRYSATHRNPYNVVYRLSPFDAYRQNIVKRIEVASVVKTDDANQAFMRLESVKTLKNTITAKLTAHKLMKDGTVKETSFTLKPDSDLAELTNLPQYAGLTVEEIDVVGQRVLFTNGVELTAGEAQGADKDAIFEAQIRYTVEEHMRKAKRFRDAGIKVLSLFFIDHVDNYVLEDGLIKKLFDKAYLALRDKHPEWKQWEPDEVRAAYFAQRKVKGTTEAVDTTGKSAADAYAYDLIMKDKERLLSFESPVAFIFSHSALREGWDNPNVFQICTLNQTASEIKKRQEVGRGIRLAVNQTGERVHEEAVNVLTVVANESYEQYVASLQSEIEAEYGASGVPPKPPRAERVTVRLNKKYLLSDDFKNLWEKIKHKTRYSVKIDTDKLVGDVLAELDKAVISKPRVEIRKADVTVDKEEAFKALLKTGAKTLIDLSGKYPLPNLVELLLHQLEHTSPPVRLTRATLARIVRETKRKADAALNPQEFVRVATDILKDKLAESLIDGIEYEKMNAWYEMSQFEDFESWREHLVPAKHSVYDATPFDSEIEQKFAEGLEAREDVRLYVKLPSWFTVPTPVGEYNPDWAIVMNSEDEGKPVLYLVRETKGTTNPCDLRPDEKRKIICGKKHFKDALAIDYKVVAKASEV
ncbi:MAG: DEAD/DEAH box helicase family protein [Patescibacteria group bacterium]|jgi:type III restriction enzyme